MSATGSRLFAGGSGIAKTYRENIEEYMKIKRTQSKSGDFGDCASALDVYD